MNILASETYYYTGIQIVRDPATSLSTNKPNCPVMEVSCESFLDGIRMGYCTYSTTTIEVEFNSSTNPGKLELSASDPTDMLPGAYRFDLTYKAGTNLDVVAVGEIHLVLPCMISSEDFEWR